MGSIVIGKGRGSMEGKREGRREKGFKQLSPKPYVSVLRKPPQKSDYIAVIGNNH